MSLSEAARGVAKKPHDGAVRREKDADQDRKHLRNSILDERDSVRAGFDLRRAILRRYPGILRAAFPGSSPAWLRALTSTQSPPDQPGFVWFDPATGGLVAARRRDTSARA